MDCRTVRDNLCAYRDGELDKQTTDEIEAHLAQCKECQKKEDVLGQVDGIVGLVYPIAPSQGHEERFLKKLALVKEVEAPEHVVTVGISARHGISAKLCKKTHPVTKHRKLRRKVKAKKRRIRKRK